MHSSVLVNSIDFGPREIVSFEDYLNVPFGCWEKSNTEELDCSLYVSPSFFQKTQVNRLPQFEAERCTIERLFALYKSINHPFLKWCATGDSFDLSR
jgi:hypothetical protein